MGTRTASCLLLLVEDEVAVCDLLECALRDEGFEVVVAQTGSAALILLSRYHNEMAALITDIDLGSATTGWSVSAAARDLQPRLPVFYMSGASAHDWPARGVADSTMFAKPFPLDHLTNAVAAALRPARQI